MAQEQAKSAPEKENADNEAEAKGPLEAMMRGTAGDEVEDTPTLPRRSSLADRLKAEQRRRDVPRGDTSSKTDDAKAEAQPEGKSEPNSEPMEASSEQPSPPARPLPLKAPQIDKATGDAAEAARDAAGPAPSNAATGAAPAGSAPSPKHLARSRRPAGPPPQRRLSAPANDDIPSIGGLIFALQQRPARTPFTIAAVASAVWFILGGFFAFGVIADASSTASAILSSTAAILIPIIIFWFLALLVWRAQELRLMASAMT
ncbi:MAG: hypothetical protein AAF405_03870, partial [Pseudomonadota bacterium]